MLDVRRTLPTLIAAVAAVIVPVAPASASGLVEFAAGLTPHSKPAGIARGADGNVWARRTATPGASSG